MYRPRLKFAGALGVTAAVLSLSYLSAQPPEDRPKDGPGRGFKGKFGPRDRNEENPSAHVDREVEEWVRMLAEKITDRHDEIRDSARAALTAVGPAALPTLRRLADGNDGATATAARKVIGRIEHHGPPGPFGMMTMGGTGGPALGRRPDGDRGDGPRPGPFGGDRPMRKDEPRAKGDRPARPRDDRGGPAEKGERRPEGPPRGGPEQFARAIRSLNLSDEQRQKVEELVQAQQAKLQRIRDRVRDGDLAPEEARATARREMEAVREKLRDVLTSDQFRRFESEMRPPGDN